jgi:uncharacterized protein
MANRLQNENSPYLLQHAQNPVDWHPWGPEAFARAKREDKPVFLSIGYSACHWCHVMAHESFEDPEIAGILNKNFICIKVDREERPDVDSIYMGAVVALTGQGGWPLSVFLSPDGKPFYGGTYFPPVPRHGLPSFKDVLNNIIGTWLVEREKIAKTSDKLLLHINEQSTLTSASYSIQKFSLDLAVDNLESSYDWMHGGWGAAPKFPQPMVIEFLLRQATRGNDRALRMATHTLEAMCKGGMYDVIGGGFHRYSTDFRWLIPHFEKMLYDNAQLSLVYLHAYKLTGDKQFLKVCESTLDFIQRELANSNGGFYSSLDADSNDQEGSCYLWSVGEVEHNLDDAEDFNLFSSAYTLTSRGNFEGRNVIQKITKDSELAEVFSIPIDQVPDRLAKINAELLKVRLNRPKPNADDKTLASWNALALQAFAEAGRYLKRADYLNIAARNARFLLTSLHPNDRLFRSWRAGQAKINAYLEDYASLIVALLSLYQSDSNLLWYRAAEHLCTEMINNYKDPNGGFFDVRSDQQLLITRPKEFQDNAIPSGNALACVALLTLSLFSPRDDYSMLAIRMLELVQDNAVQYPTGFAYWLNALDLALGPVKQVAILTNNHDTRLQALQDVVWERYRPRCIYASSPVPPGTGAPALFTDRTPINDSPGIYVCEGFVCKLPTTSPEELKRLLT